MEAITWKFISAEDLLDYAVNHPEKEVGFTCDTSEDVYAHGEPMGWYAIKFTRAFDGESLVFGYYGCGVVWANDSVDDWVLQEFWKSQFNEEIDMDRMICVDAADIEDFVEKGE